MSGDGSTGEIFGTAGRGVDCASLFFTTALASPVAAVVRSLRKEDELTLELRSADSNIVLAKTGEDLVAGSIVSPYQAKLVRCMRDGFSFIGLVRSVKGGSCEIDVRPK